MDLRETRLERAIRSVFAEWTLVQLALEHGWAGRNARQLVDDAISRILSQCSAARQRKRALKRDDFEDALLDLVDDLNAVAEDGSAGAVAALLAELFAEATRVDESAATPRTDRVLGRSEQAKSAVNQSTRNKRDDEESDSDEEDDDEEEGHDDNANANANDNANDNVVALNTSSTTTTTTTTTTIDDDDNDNDDNDGKQPATDDDGWTTVTKSKGRR
jgi:pre-rRNA-processing protein TSR2